MTQSLNESLLSWAADCLGADAKIIAIRGLRHGSSPWSLQIEHAGRTHELVLRTAGWVEPRQISTGAAALRVAEERGLTAPRLVAADLDGEVTGTPATLETSIPGNRIM